MISALMMRKLVVYVVYSAVVSALPVLAEAPRPSAPDSFLQELATCLQKPPSRY